MNQYLYLTTFLLILACGNQKKTNTDFSNTQNSTELTKNNYNVKLNVTRYFPYCGGAKPTEEMLNKHAPEVNYFVLININNNKKQTFKTNLKGNKIFLLPLGKYAIKEKFKDVSFDEFYKINSKFSGNFIKNLSKDCYRKWWQTNLIEFTITDTTKIINLDAIVKDYCFTGSNPCLQYTGPYPP